MPSLPKTFRPPHLPSRAVEQQERRQAFDDRRGSASERGYNWPWAKAAKGHLRNHPLCIGCEAAGRVEPAVLVDHVEPHKGDTKKFWDTSKWQSSCSWHHDVVKQRLEVMWSQGKIGVEDLRLDSAVALQLAAKLRA